jgi:hypothetical protein
MNRVSQGQQGIPDSGAFGGPGRIPLVDMKKASSFQRSAFSQTTY